MPRRYGHNKLVLKWLQNNLSQLRKILIFVDILWGKKSFLLLLKFFLYPSMHIYGENNFNKMPWMVLISMHGSLTYSFLLSQRKCHNQNIDLQSSWSIWLRRTQWISRPASLPPSLRVTSLLAAAAASRLLVSPLMVRPRVAALRRMIREHPRSLGARHVCRKDFQWLSILSAKILKTTPQWRSL